MPRILLALLLCIVLASCGLMSPQQQSDALASIESMLANRVITREQYDALREAILSAGTAHWWEQAVTALTGAALAYIGVRVNRGAPESVRTQRAATPARA